MMIFLWALGDSFKFVYYVMRKQPLQFILCSVIQITFDFSILSQFYIYKKNKEQRIETIVKETLDKLNSNSMDSIDV